MKHWELEPVSGTTISLQIVPQITLSSLPSTTSPTCMILICTQVILPIVLLLNSQPLLLPPPHYSLPALCQSQTWMPASNILINAYFLAHSSSLLPWLKITLHSTETFNSLFTVLPPQPTCPHFHFYSVLNSMVEYIIPRLQASFFGPPFNFTVS